MYHETLIKWRRFVQELRKHNDKTTLLLDYKNILKNHSPYALPQAWTPASDKQIIHNTTAIQTQILVMKRNTTPLFCLLAILLPIIGFAQTDGDYSNLLQFLKGDGAEMVYGGLYQTGQQRSGQCCGSALVGRAIGGLGALMYLGYGLANGGGRPGMGNHPDAETHPYWIYPRVLEGFVNMIQAPFEAIANRELPFSATLNPK
jgi:hypothetical protein